MRLRTVYVTIMGGSALVGIHAGFSPWRTDSSVYVELYDVVGDTRVVEGGEVGAGILVYATSLVMIGLAVWFWSEERRGKIRLATLLMAVASGVVLTASLASLSAAARGVYVVASSAALACALSLTALVTYEPAKDRGLLIRPAAKSAGDSPLARLVWAALIATAALATLTLPLWEAGWLTFVPGAIPLAFVIWLWADAVPTPARLLALCLMIAAVPIWSIAAFSLSAEESGAHLAQAAGGMAWLACMGVLFLSRGSQARTPARRSRLSLAAAWLLRLAPPVFAVGLVLLLIGVLPDRLPVGAGHRIDLFHRVDTLHDLTTAILALFIFIAFVAGVVGGRVREQGLAPFAAGAVLVFVYGIIVGTLGTRPGTPLLLGALGIDSEHGGSEYIVMTIRFFVATAPIGLVAALAGGGVVQWRRDLAAFTQGRPGTRPAPL